MSVQDKKDEPPFYSLACNDPRVTYIVETASPKFGYGIYGFFENAFQASAVSAWLTKNGCTIVGIQPYDPNAKVEGGMHRYIDLHLKGYL